MQANTHAHVCVCVCVHVCVCVCVHSKRLYSANETYNFKEPTSGLFNRDLLQNIVSLIGIFCKRDL